MKKSDSSSECKWRCWIWHFILFASACFSPHLIVRVSFVRPKFKLRYVWFKKLRLHRDKWEGFSLMATALTSLKTAFESVSSSTYAELYISQMDIVRCYNPIIIIIYIQQKKSNKNVDRNGLFKKNRKTKRKIKPTNEFRWNSQAELIIATDISFEFTSFNIIDSYIFLKYYYFFFFRFSFHFFKRDHSSCAAGFVSRRGGRKNRFWSSPSRPAMYIMKRNSIIKSRLVYSFG